MSKIQCASCQKFAAELARLGQHYPGAFVDKDMVNRGKMRNEAHRQDSKNVEVIMSNEIFCFT